jgi:hypothetical protein
MAHNKETSIDVGTDHGDRDYETKRTGSLVIKRAKAATDKEHKMTLMEGIKTYPKAIGWSMLISTCIAMEAFDLCLLNTFCEQYTTFTIATLTNQMLFPNLHVSSVSTLVMASTKFLHGGRQVSPTAPNADRSSVSSSTAGHQNDLATAGQSLSALV